MEDMFFKSNCEAGANETLFMSRGFPGVSGEESFQRMSGPPGVSMRLNKSESALSKPKVSLVALVDLGEWGESMAVLVWEPLEFSVSFGTSLTKRTGAEF